MNRIMISAASALVALSGVLLTTSRVESESRNGLTLFGKVDGLNTDGAFPATVTIKDPIPGMVLAESQTLVNVNKGKYQAKVDSTGLPDGVYEVALDGLEAAEGLEMVEFVQLQAGSPGTGQTGHLNISGNILAGKIGLGVAPALARLQINEPGGLQGVRSITQSGVSVYGQSNAATGLGAGGYFTTSSVGGRGMVGDALSPTGSTVGGLFFNRSDQGVAVWGRHINTQGASIGVYGQTASGDGTGVVAENTATGDVVRLAGVNGTIESQGILPQHIYAGSTPKTMVPYAYGSVSAAGSVLASTGNYSVTKVSTGVYEISLPNITFAISQSAIVVTPVSTTSKTFTVDGPVNADDFTVKIFNTAGSPIDFVFSWVLYVATPVNPAVRGSGTSESRPAMPLPVDRTEIGRTGLNRPTR